MGIPKLTNFVNERYDWRSIRVKPGSKIVIDGYSLCYPLYSRRHAWQLGGDYREFYDTVTRYFQDLMRLNIEPYVVIDGVDYDGVKLDTNRCRFEQKLRTMKGRLAQESVLPLFAKSVFVDVLRDMGVNFCVADGEADQDVVSLANEMGCPVLGKDSDYFIFNIEGGYIPVCDVNGCLVDLSGSVRCFSYVDFDHQFSFCDPDLRLYIPVFLGNDFQNGYSSPRLAIDSSMPIGEIVSRIGDINEERMRDVQASEKKTTAENFYRVPPRSYVFLAGSRFLCTRNPNIPQWALNLYKRGQFMQELMCLLCSRSKIWEYSVVIEDVNKASAWGIAQKLKRYIFGLLLPQSRVDLCIVDRHVNDCRLSNEVLPWSAKYDGGVDRSLADMSDLAENDRRDILLRILNCKSAKRRLNSDIPDGLKLVVIASRRWLKDIKDDHVHDLLHRYVNSLVCCVLSCYSSSVPPVRAIPAIGVNQLDVVHVFAQWQCVLHHVIALNQVLCLPYQYTSLAKLFSGSLLHHYLQNPQLVQEKMDTLANAEDMLAVITRDVFSDSSPEAESD